MIIVVSDRALCYKQHAHPNGHLGKLWIMMRGHSICCDDESKYHQGDGIWHSLTAFHDAQQPGSEDSYPEPERSLFYRHINVLAGNRTLLEVGEASNLMPKIEYNRCVFAANKKIHVW